jgi:hypothetical protein
VATQSPKKPKSHAANSRVGDVQPGLEGLNPEFGGTKTFVRRQGNDLMDEDYSFV